MPEFDLTGKVAVITGGSRGLGREIAYAYARHGATVVVASRKAQACVELAEEITRQTGREAVGIGCHVGEWAQCEQLAAEVSERFGRVDVLVNNAGLSPHYGSLVEVSEALFDKVLAVNLKGAFRLSSLMGTQMAAAGGGSIINVSSVASVAPAPEEIPYAIAKAGLNALTAGMARAFGPTVRVNTIMPGPMLTDISAAWDMARFEQTAKERIPLRRGGRPDEIVGAALFLASEEASGYVSGARIALDGGLSSLP
ncbi:SDR family NAD(P)-dependent oxidoreductase [Nocardia asteroides]|uniref:SDR family NAD(P)-dependent oxidoreductase n=1 Tax=Nocardia asteroides TaxID=1824 RepID=UPI001E563794|nr:glucose 1-dehydrogenase [Nocardia asteroides]UGT55104.1 glucose 1-dehydrogenase [Nocardia asteroides]